MIEELKGKTLHGAEIFDIRHGREEVPEEIKNMGRKFGHEPNTSTGLWFQASCKVKGKTYLADLRWTPDEGNECMIFRFIESGRSYYSRRGIPLTIHSLLKCVDDFAKDGGGTPYVGQVSRHCPIATRREWKEEEK